MNKRGWRRDVPGRVREIQKALIMEIIFSVRNRLTARSRVRDGYTQSDIARVMGVSRAYVSALLHESNPPAEMTLTTAVNLLDAVGLRLVVVVEGDPRVPNDDE